MNANNQQTVSLSPSVLRWALFFMSILHPFSEGVAQKRQKKSAIVSEQPQNFDINQLFSFPNVNKVRYYSDKSQLNRLRKLDKTGKTEQLYPLLWKYVSKFGIDNFRKDTYWLWRLANLTEEKGAFHDAQRLYKLVLKHHHGGVDFQKVQSKYYKMAGRSPKDYVPLDYYYDLISFREKLDTLRPPQGIDLNMGFYVNSNKSDYGPSMSWDNQTMIFTSQRNAVRRSFDPEPNEDLFMIRSLGDGYWDEAVPVKSLNTPANEGSPFLTRDGSKIYFSRCNTPQSYGNCDLFVAHLQADSTWGEISNLGQNVNSVAWESHPSLSPTEDTLYFASDRIGGFGMSDLYYTTKNKNGQWSKAKNLGPNINTRGSEVSPFIHPEYNVLYYSSSGQLINFGEFDIYKAYHLKNKQWTEPQNIGPLVNGRGSEFYFTIDKEAKNLYYAKSIENNMKNLDLYSFPLPMEAQPLATTKLKGQLLDSLSNTPFNDGIVSIIDLDKGVEIAPKYLRDDGTYEFDLINERKYLMVIQGDEFFRIEKIFTLQGDTNFTDATRPISSRMQFESVVFDNNSFELKSAMYYDLDKIGNFLLDNPSFKLKIAGHTDTKGNKQANIELSQKRADAIKDYIEYFGGIKSDRIEAIGYGAQKPLVEEKTEADRVLNRRVEFEIYRDASAEDHRKNDENDPSRW
ncbi:OmpA family protein [Persicobacter psychrovividus]